MQVIKDCVICGTTLTGEQVVACSRRCASILGSKKRWGGLADNIAKCAVCGKEFSWRGGDRRVVCSKTCGATRALKAQMSRLPQSDDPAFRECVQCGELKPLDSSSFPKGGKAFRWECLDCSRKNANERRAQIVAWWYEYKAGLSCIRCGESHPACIEFHHRDPKTKTLSIGDSAASGGSKTRIMAEIAKCDVLCPNCHRKEHWRQRQEKKSALAVLP